MASMKYDYEKRESRVGTVSRITFGVVQLSLVDGVDVGV